MTDTVLCINAGSSSLKFKVFEAATDGDLPVRLEGQLEGIGDKPHLAANDGEGRQLVDQGFTAAEIPDVGAAVPRILDWLRDHLKDALPVVVGHRVLLGGTRYAAPVLIDDEVFSYLGSIEKLAPLHMPSELSPIAAIRSLAPELPQVAVFDTSFHRGHAEAIQRLPVPDALHQEGVLRYGYHGISYEYISQKLPEVAPDIAKGKVVVAHLGSGCSLCALDNGKSVDSTMSFTALDGVPMGTRPGHLDPGAVLYLFQVKGMSPKEVEHFLYKECGLKGLSGVSNDVRELLESNAPRAKMALEHFSLNCARAVAQLATVMGGIDALVFTAGVGEHAAPVRAAIAERLAWLGLELDEAANAAHGPRIASEGSAVDCYVVPTNEELMIARHSLALVRGHA